MKKVFVTFLQLAVILIGLIALIALIRMPMLEGRAVNLDLFHIYADPFILYGYAASVAFFVALYKAFRLLGYIAGGEVFSIKAVGTLRSIKVCAVILAVMIIGAGIFIRIKHGPQDDPAGFLALSMITTFACAVVATAAAIFEKLLQNATDMKSENDLTV